MGVDTIVYEKLNECDIPELLRARRTDVSTVFLSAPELESLRTARIELRPPDGMWPRDGFEFFAMEICDGRQQPEDAAIRNHMVRFRAEGDKLVARVLNPILGLQYKCAVDLPEPIPSRECLEQAFGEVGWREPTADGQIPNRRWFLIGAPGLVCTSKEGYRNDFLPYSPQG